MKRKTDLSPLKYLIWVGQLGISLILPIILCVYGAVLLRSRFGIGTWVVFLGLFLGLGGAFISLLRFIDVFTKAAEREKKSDNR